MSVNVNTTTNTVVVQNANQTITIVDNENNNNVVNVTQPLVNVIEVASPGPQGQVGPVGPIGPSAPFIEVSPNIWATTSSIQVTGSLTISGSSTFTNIGPTILSGSTSISGSLTVNGYDIVTVNQTSSLSVLSSSYAATASLAPNYVLTSSTSSMSVLFASTSSFLNTLNQNLTLNGGLTVTGSLNITGSTTMYGNLTVFGTASYNYITASQLDVGINIISVNVAEPGERFGGLLVYDSGSFSHQATASLLWDSLNNHWVYQNASGGLYSGGMLLSGPRNTGSLGDEPSLTRFLVPRSDGGDHLNNTQIYSSGSITQVTGSLLVSSSNLPGLDTNLGVLQNSLGISTADWENSSLTDLLSNESIDWENRYLVYPDGSTTAINFGTQNQILTSGSITSRGVLLITSSNIAPSPITSSAFIDDYNRGTLSPGGTPLLTYTNTNTGAGNATIVTNYLNIVNGNPAGVSYTTVPLSGFSSPFNPTLSSNTGNIIEWTFNLRTNRGSIFSGFGAGQYGGAVVLVGSNTNVQTLGQGYALIYGNTGTRNWKLVKYNNGLQGTLTDVIPGGTFASNTSYVSVKITYVPSTNTWSYYFRDDGVGGWGDPTTVNTLIGTIVDNTYTSTLMSVFGVYFNYSTAANQNLQFDNLRVNSYQTFPLVPQNMITVKDALGNHNTTITDTGTIITSGSIVGYGGISGSFSGSYIGNGTNLVLGQTGSSVFGTGVLSVTSAITTLTLIPGLTTTLTIPSTGTYMVYIATNGGINTTSTSGTGVSAIDVAIQIDGAILAAGGYNRMYADNPSANATVTNYVANWNMHVVTPLSAGPHTVTVNAAFVAGSTATVSGGAGTIKQGTLTIMILKAS